MVVACRHGLQMPRAVLVSCETTNELARVSLNSGDKHNGRDQYRNSWTPPHGRYSSLFSDLLQADAGFPDPLYGGPGLRRRTGGN